MKKESLTVMMMMKEKTRLASTWCSTQPPMTKHSVAAPRDLSFVIKTTSFDHLTHCKGVILRETIVLPRHSPKLGSVGLAPRTGSD